MRIRKVGKPKIVIQQEAEIDSLAGWVDALLYLIVGGLMLAGWLLQ